MKRITIFCALALLLALLSGCRVTSPEDEEFLEDWADSIDESAEDWAQDWEAAWEKWSAAWDSENEEGAEKDHYWKIQDLSDPEGAMIEAGTVTDEKQVKALDDLLSDDGGDLDHLAEDPGDPAYSYIYCQQETLTAGQKEEDLEYQELVRFTVSGSEDVVTMRILNMPSLLGADLGDVLTFSYAVSAEAAEALRNPGQFLE